jgi:hypothetical protein
VRSRGISWIGGWLHPGTGLDATVSRLYAVLHENRNAFPPDACHTGTWRSTVKKLIISLLLLECQWLVFRSAQRLSLVFMSDRFPFEVRCHSEIWHLSTKTKGHVVSCWLRHYATSQKVAVSIPNEVTGFFNLPNSSSLTMVLGLTQPLTEMSTRNLPVGKGRPVLKADNLTAICEPIVQKMWKPRRLTNLWPSMACYRDSFTVFYLSTKIKWQRFNIKLLKKILKENLNTARIKYEYHRKWEVAIVAVSIWNNVE